jgi:hypothetical protein
MAEARSNGSKSKTQAKRATTEAKKSAAKTASASKRAATKAAAAEKNQVQAVVETAVDVPVGAVLAASDRLNELVEPWTDRSKAERQIKSYRSNLRKSLKRTERRGSTARRRALTEARRNRNEVEQRVRRAIEVPTSRAQEVVGTAQGVVGAVSSQIPVLR